MESNQDKGFTLVELLIVIVILGILATVTVFAVRGITDQGQTSACETDQKTLQTAVETWYAQYGGGDLDGVQTLKDATVTPATNSAADNLVAAGFLVETPTNYSVNADGTLAVPANSKCTL